MNKMYKILYAIIILTLAGCSSSTQLAPVTDGWRQAQHAQAMHRVEKGETLYSIAWGYGLDYRDLAKINHIQAPYSIHVGQALYLNKPILKKSNRLLVESSAPVSTPSAHPVLTKATVPAHLAVSSKPVMVSKTDITTNSPVKNWIWPTTGKILQGYESNNGMNKGLDISGNLGQPIKASAGGKVVYCGSGLRGYGNLIIIKHNDEFLSAYAHNQNLLVHEGQSVKLGEVIATMGNSEAKHPLLHFEIRRAGKPIDPLRFLPSRGEA